MNIHDNFQGFLNLIKIFITKTKIFKQVTNNKAWLKTIPNESKGQISLGSSSLGLKILKILITTMLFQTTTMVSRLENFKFLNYNNGLRSGGGVGGQVKLYTHLMNLRFVKNCSISFYLIHQYLLMSRCCPFVNLYDNLLIKNH